MARGLSELGVTRVYLTPHQFRLGNRFAVADLDRRTEGVVRILAGACVPIEVRCSAEHYYGEELLDAVAGRGDLVPFEWEDESCLLVELPIHQPAVGVRRVGEALVRRGIRPVLAHPERVAGLSRDRDRVRGWRDAGWRFQLNLLSLVGRHGPEAEDLSKLFLAEGLYTFAGSDLHRPSELPHLREAHRAFRELSTREVRA
jgi:protein-tyrosine phosphatase